MAPVAKVPIVAVHLRLDGTNGEMSVFLTLALPWTRLDALARENPLPAGWTTTILDHSLVPIATSSPASGDIPPVLRERLREPEVNRHFVISDGAGACRQGSNAPPRQGIRL